MYIGHINLIVYIEFTKKKKKEFIVQVATAYGDISLYQVVVVMACVNFTPSCQAHV
jgi:hypothetical protein